MNMQRPQTPESDPNSTFQDGYTRAVRLILQYNDLDGAIDCLRKVKPRSQSTLWLWTDLMATLLLKRNMVWECYRALAFYRHCYPHDHRVAFPLQMLEHKLAKRNEPQTCP
jgi:hypothetical protein